MASCHVHTYNGLYQTISIHPRCYIKRSIDCLRRSPRMFKFPSLYMASLFIKFKDQIKWILNLYAWWDILIRENGIYKWNFILLYIYTITLPPFYKVTFFNLIFLQLTVNKNVASSCWLCWHFSIPFTLVNACCV